MKCKTCGGTGEKITAVQMLTLRQVSGLSQKDCAAAMGISASYLSDLEKGKRDWNTDLFERAKKAYSKSKPQKS